MALDYTALLGTAITAGASYALGRKQINSDRKLVLQRELQESNMARDMASGNQQYNQAIRNNPGSAMARVAAAGSPMAMLSTCGSTASDPSNPILIFVVVLALGLACIGLARYALKNKRKW